MRNSGHRCRLSRPVHAQKYATLRNSELVGIADPSGSARDAVSAELRVPAHADYRELLGRVDAVSIVTPTPYHFSVAKEFLEAGAHVLVEKPMTATVEEGIDLIEGGASRPTHSAGRTFGALQRGRPGGSAHY